MNPDGTSVPGFPLRPEGFTYLNGATIGDVDGDGDIELGVISYLDSTAPRVNLYDLEAAYRPAEVPWETYHQNRRRGGLVDSEERLRQRGFFGAAEEVAFLLHGEPGSKAFLVASGATDKRRFEGLGWLLVDRDRLTNLVVNATIPTGGQFEFVTTLPGAPRWIGRTFFFQGAVGVDPRGGDGRLTNLLGRTVQ